MNDVKLMGRIAQLGELQEKKETKWINFTLAVNRYVKGEQQTDFLLITAFGKLAEKIAKYCAKGNLIVVEARLKVDKYKDKNKKTIQKLSLIAEEVYFCDRKKKEEKDDELDEELREFFEEAPEQKEDDLPY